ncbi:MAG TPA: alpha-galactosidase [Chloroflexota bacterium]|jgi:alpha-galactosidase|nr:alpha-galactosidase [Chloroflexota bacterium]
MTSGAPTTQEQSRMRDWLAATFRPEAAFDPARFPVSFRYDGRESASVLKDWPAEWGPSGGAGVSRQVLSLTDPSSGLRVRCELTAFADFPAVEWVAHFENSGAAETPIVADVQPLDVVFPASSRQEPCWVHHAKGSQCQLDDFEPLHTQLSARGDLRLAARKGRSSNGTLPFFNLELGDGGVVGAIGWTGGWAASFERDADGHVRARAGMPKTHLKLLPGERIRTPRILLLFWNGDRLHGHNMLRRFILAHHTPRPNGQLLRAPICDGHWGDRTAGHQIAKARWITEHDLPIESFWIDADWYGDAPHDESSDTFGRTWYLQAGNWFPRKGAYPGGLKPVGDALKELGLGFVLWVEPERVSEGTRIAREHPEWLLGPIGGNYLFDLGIPEARRYLTDLVSDLIAEAGVTCYRQDFNTDPAPFWDAADAPDRVGMAEIRHVEGLYAFWDELLARHPGLIIDNCSSGGRRIDLETTSRSIPLWRSDVQCFPGFSTTAMQAQTHGLGLWVPLSTGAPSSIEDTYTFRSALGPGIVLGVGERGLKEGDAFPLEALRRHLAELCAVREYFYGDFYPLLSFNLAEDAWAAWQFDRPDLDAGMVLAFRRPDSPFGRLEAPLRGLDAGARYELRWLDDDRRQEVAGRALLETGPPIEIAEKPGSALLVYRRVA